MLEPDDSVTVMTSTQPENRPGARRSSEGNRVGRGARARHRKPTHAFGHWGAAFEKIASPRRSGDATRTRSRARHRSARGGLGRGRGRRRRSLGRRKCLAQDYRRRPRGERQRDPEIARPEHPVGPGPHAHRTFWPGSTTTGPIPSARRKRPSPSTASHSRSCCPSWPPGPTSTCRSA